MKRRIDAMWLGLAAGLIACGGDDAVDGSVGDAGARDATLLDAMPLDGATPSDGAPHDASSDHADGTVEPRDAEAIDVGPFVGLDAARAPYDGGPAVDVATACMRTFSTPIVHVDADGDGVPEDWSDARLTSNAAPAGFDNCPGVPNTDQADSDGDRIGDACATAAANCAALRLYASSPVSLAGADLRGCGATIAQAMDLTGANLTGAFLDVQRPASLSGATVVNARVAINGLGTIAGTNFDGSAVTGWIVSGMTIGHFGEIRSSSMVGARLRSYGTLIDVNLDGALIESYSGLGPRMFGGSARGAWVQAPVTFWSTDVRSAVFDVAGGGTVSFEASTDASGAVFCRAANVAAIDSRVDGLRCAATLSASCLRRSSGHFDPSCGMPTCSSLAYDPSVDLLAGCPAEGALGLVAPTAAEAGHVVELVVRNREPSDQLYFALDGGMTYANVLSPYTQTCAGVLPVQAPWSPGRYELRVMRSGMPVGSRWIDITP